MVAKDSEVRTTSALEKASSVLGASKMTTVDMSAIFTAHAPLRFA
jgi:hypothetical protein